MGNWKLPPYIKLEGESLVYNGEGEFWFYVAEKYFTTKNAFFVGQYANILGILDYTIVKNGKNNGIHQFYFPSVFLTEPSAQEKIKQVRLIKTGKVQDYRILKYKKGDKIVVSVFVPQDITFVESLFKMLIIEGNVPDTVKYDDQPTYLMDSMQINGSNFGMTYQLLAIIFAGIGRDVNNVEIPFRNSKHLDDPTAFRSVSIKFLPKLLSAYTSLISENTDEALSGSILLSRKKETPNVPMERVMTK